MSEQTNQAEIGAICYCDSGDDSDTAGSAVTSQSDVTNESDDSSQSDNSVGTDGSSDRDSFTESDSSGESDTTNQSGRSSWSDETRSEISSESDCSTGCDDTSGKDSRECRDGVSQKWKSAVSNIFKNSEDESDDLNSEEENSADQVANLYVPGRSRPLIGFYSECLKSDTDSDTDSLTFVSKEETSTPKKSRKRVRPNTPVAKVGEEIFDVCGIRAKRQKRNGKFQYRLRWTSDIWVDEEDIDAVDLLAEFNSKEMIQIGDKMWEPVHDFIMHSPRQSVLDHLNNVRPDSLVAKVGEEVFDVCGILAKRQKPDGKFQFRLRWTSNIWVDEEDIDAADLLAEFNSKEMIQIGDKMWEPVHDFIMHSPRQSVLDQPNTGVDVPVQMK